MSSGLLFHHDMRSSQMREHRLNALVEILATFRRPLQFTAADILELIKTMPSNGRSESLSIFIEYILSFPTLTGQMRGISQGFQHEETWMQLSSRLLRDHFRVLSSIDSSKQTFRLTDAFPPRQTVEHDGISVRNTPSPTFEYEEDNEEDNEEINESLVDPLDREPREPVVRPFLEKPCPVAWCECILDLVSRNPTREYSILELLDHFNSMYPKIKGSKWEEDSSRRAHFIKAHNKKITELLAPYGLCVQSRLNPDRIMHSRMLYSFPPITKGPEPELANNGRPLRKRNLLVTPAAEEQLKKVKEDQDQAVEQKDDFQEQRHFVKSKRGAGRSRRSTKTGCGYALTSRSLPQFPPSRDETPQSKLTIMKSAYDLLKAQTQLHIQYFDLLLRNMDS